jgi:small multidrug resistance pump
VNPVILAYGALAAAIVAEVTGSSLIYRTAQFTKLWPSIGVALCFGFALFLLSHATKVIPLGMAYAIWGGVGTVLTAAVSVLVYRHVLDAAAMLGIAMIIGGVVVMNLFSHSASH